jgi:hypothetical protein
MKYLEKKKDGLWKISRNEEKRRFRSEVIGSWNFVWISHMIQLMCPSDKKGSMNQYLNLIITAFFAACGGACNSKTGI